MNATRQGEPDDVMVMVMDDTIGSLALWIVLCLRIICTLFGTVNPSIASIPTLLSMVVATAMCSVAELPMTSYWFPFSQPSLGTSRWNHQTFTLAIGTPTLIVAYISHVFAYSFSGPDKLSKAARLSCTTFFLVVPTLTAASLPLVVDPAARWDFETGCAALLFVILAFLPFALLFTSHGHKVFAEWAQCWKSPKKTVSAISVIELAVFTNSVSLLHSWGRVFTDQCVEIGYATTGAILLHLVFVLWMRPLRCCIERTFYCYLFTPMIAILGTLCVFTNLNHRLLPLVMWILLATISLVLTFGVLDLVNHAVLHLNSERKAGAIVPTEVSGRPTLSHTTPASDGLFLLVPHDPLALTATYPLQTPPNEIALTLTQAVATTLSHPLVAPQFDTSGSADASCLPMHSAVWFAAHHTVDHEL